MDAEPQIEKWFAGDTEDARSLLFNFAWELKKSGQKETTIRAYLNTLKALIKRGADLTNPESVREVLAKIETWNESTRRTATVIYSTFLRTQGLTWTEPKYAQREKLPFIPTERDR